MNWIQCTDWNDLPDGEWLIKTSKSKSYQVAEATTNDKGGRVIIVGNHFYWDSGNIIAYTAFEKYGEPNQEDRKTTLLKATLDLLIECSKGPYVKSPMTTSVYYDGADCDGGCLANDIAIELGIDEPF